MDLQQISDELEIAALLTRYATAVDTKDWTLYRSVFTDDAHIDYSSAGAIAGTRDEVADWLAQAFEATPMTMHYVTNVETDIVGDTASVRAMFYNPMQLPGNSELSSCGGYYNHRLVRTLEGWRSSYLREVSVWFVNPPAVAPAEAVRSASAE
jgi:3-phenylpropionate/cinnamic acid dioxygenase small subunit